MKKTLTVNLGGTVFHIDEDAYRLLDNYLSNLKLYFNKQEGAQEIVEDIETRISELFHEKICDGQQVITIADVEEVIARMGQPQDFDATDEAEESKQTHQKEESKQSTEYVNFGKRLYRNPDDKILGGVIGGFAAYTGWDPTLLRLIALVLIFCYGVMIPIYFICWMIIPEAQTAAEKLAMRGEAINVENIGKTVTDGFEKAANGVNDFMKSGKPRSFFQQVGDALVTIAGWILKIILIFFAIVLFPFVFALVIALFAMIVAAIAAVIGGGQLLMSLPFYQWATAVAACSGIGFFGMAMMVAVIAIPLFSLIYAILSTIFKWNGMNTIVKWILVVFWFIAVGVTIFTLSNCTLISPLIFF